MMSFKISTASYLDFFQFSFCFYKKYLLQKTFCKIKQNLFPESQFFRNQSAHVPICSAEFSFFFSRNGIPAIPRFKRCLLCLFYLHFHFITDFFRLLSEFIPEAVILCHPGKPEYFIETGKDLLCFLISALYKYPLALLHLVKAPCAKTYDTHQYKQQKLFYSFYQQITLRPIVFFFYIHICCSIFFLYLAADFPHFYHSLLLSRSHVLLEYWILPSGCQN